LVALSGMVFAFCAFLNVSYDTPLPWWSGCLCFFAIFLGYKFGHRLYVCNKEGNCNFSFSTKCLNSDVVVVIDHWESYTMHASSVSVSCYLSRAAAERAERDMMRASFGRRGKGVETCIVLPTRFLKGRSRETGHEFFHHDFRNLRQAEDMFLALVNFWKYGRVWLC
jgi:hypothetical protein